jgi:hypothetical protein
MGPVGGHRAKSKIPAENTARSPGKQPIKRAKASEDKAPEKYDRNKSTLFTGGVKTDSMIPPCLRIPGPTHNCLQIRTLQSNGAPAGSAARLSSPLRHLVRPPVCGRSMTLKMCRSTRMSEATHVQSSWLPRFNEGRRLSVGFKASLGWAALAGIGTY